MSAPGQDGILRPGVEMRTPDEQRRIDRATYRRQIAYLFGASPFYRRKLAAAGLRDAAAAGDLDGIAALPFTEKDEIRRSQAEHPPLGDHLAAPRSSVARIFSTSGTTGDPVYMPVTHADLAMWTEISSRAYVATGLRPGMTAVSTYGAVPSSPAPRSIPSPHSAFATFRSAPATPPASSARCSSWRRMC